MNRAHQPSADRAGTPDGAEPVPVSGKAAIPCAGFGVFPSSAEVLAELRRRNPERYDGVKNFSYTPGFGAGATVEQVADEVEKAGDEAEHPVLGLAGRLDGMAFLLEDATQQQTDVRTMQPVELSPRERMHNCTYTECAELLRLASAKLRELNRPQLGSEPNQWI